MTGVEWAAVHYRGSAPALNDLVAQNTTDVRQHHLHHQPGACRLGEGDRHHLAETLSPAPEFVPVADTLPGFDTMSFSGVGVFAGTPKAICDKIEADTRTICQDPLLRERLAGLVAETVGSTAAEFADFIAARAPPSGAS